ncbi:hypothetical protein E3P78_02724 [Wallemia ichthyophaga]|nr:hypothetical protein E3P78_02724 [Wallemia ichthyophaga]
MNLVIHLNFDHFNSNPIKSIPWLGYLKSKSISQGDYQLITGLDNHGVDFSVDQYSIECHIHLLNSLLNSINKLDVVQWVLYRLQQLLLINPPTTLNLLTNTPNINENLLQHLQNNDTYTHLSTEKLLSLSLTHSPSTHHLNSLLHSIHKDIDTGVYVDVSTLLLTQLLSLTPSKHYSYHNILPTLIPIMSHPQTPPQTTYNIIYSIWIISFDSSLCARFNTDHQIIPHLANVAKTSIKEKVVRLILATFSNLLRFAKKNTLNTFLALPIQPTLTSLSTRRWVDDDLLADLAAIQQQLSLSFASVSNWDEYASELDSGLLKWSPVHKDEQFWKNESRALLNNGGWGVKRLLGLLESDDPTTLHIALSDTASFLKYTPTAKQHIHTHHKTAIMQLLQHPDNNVKYQALLTTQLLISQSLH